MVQQYASRGALVDTNLLLLYAVGLHNRDAIEKFRRTQRFSSDDFDWLHAFLMGFHKIITTPHILAELSNLGIDTRAGRPFPHTATLLRLVSATRELWVDKDELLRNPGLAWLGVTDTGILELARRKRYLVVTDDFTLWNTLQASRCDAVNLNHIRGARWFGDQR